MTLADAGQYHCCATNTLGAGVEKSSSAVVEQSLTSVDAKLSIIIANPLEQFHGLTYQISVDQLTLLNLPN